MERDVTINFRLARDAHPEIGSYILVESNMATWGPGFYGGEVCEGHKGSKHVYLGAGGYAPLTNDTWWAYIPTLDEVKL